jgi:hypothetical protein
MRNQVDQAGAEQRCSSHHYGASPLMMHSPFYVPPSHLMYTICGDRPYLIEERLLQLLLLRLELGQMPLLQDRHPAGSNRVSHLTGLCSPASLHLMCYVGNEGTTGQQQEQSSKPPRCK